MKRAQMALCLLVLMSCCLQVSEKATTTTSTTTTYVQEATSTLPDETTLLPRPTTTLPYTPPIEVHAEIKTDKEQYNPYQKMNITIHVNSSQSLEDVDLHLYGVPGLYYPYHIERIRQIDLSAGENTFIYQYRLPDCYGCNAIDPGRYNLSLELEYDNNLLANVSKEVELR